MPVVHLAAGIHGRDIPVREQSGAVLHIPRTQFRCLIEAPGILFPCDGIIDTGAPLIIFPEAIWTRFQPGRDYEVLPFVGSTPPPSQILGWQFSYRIARFLHPLAFVDTAMTTRVERPGVVAQFADGNPRARPGVKALPPIVVGLWGGLLEGGRLGVDRNPATGGVTGELAFP